jgi:hypothetical protein
LELVNTTSVTRLEATLTIAVRALRSPLTSEPAPATVMSVTRTPVVADSVTVRLPAGSVMGRLQEPASTVTDVEPAVKLNGVPWTTPLPATCRPSPCPEGRCGW